MNEINDEKNFENRLTAVLDQSVEEIDENTLYRLQMARAEALQAVNTNRSWTKKWYTWAGVASFACAFVLTFSVWQDLSPHKAGHTDLVAIEDSNLFDDDTNIELYEEYDFYVWLSQQDAKT